MFIEGWLIDVLFVYAMFGVIYTTQLFYKLGGWLGFHGARLFFEWKGKS